MPLKKKSNWSQGKRKDTKFTVSVPPSTILRNKCEKNRLQSGKLFGRRDWRLENKTTQGDFTINMKRILETDGNEAWMKIQELEGKMSTQGLALVLVTVKTRKKDEETMSQTIIQAIIPSFWEKTSTSSTMP